MIAWLARHIGMVVAFAALVLVVVAVGVGFRLRDQDIQRIDALEKAQGSLIFATLEVQLAQKKLDAANTRLRKASSLSAKQQSRLRKRLKRDARALIRVINQLVRSGQITAEEGARLRRGVSVSLPDGIAPSGGGSTKKKKGSGGLRGGTHTTPAPPPPESPGNSDLCLKRPQISVCTNLP